MWQYPLDALREGVANAICHRNYRSGAATVIRLFDDRLEIWNPGSLPIELHPEDLLRVHNSYPPNKLLAEALYNTGLIERWGTGTLRIAEELKKQGMPPPEFDVSSQDTFKLIMYAGSSKPEREAGELELNDRQLRAVEYMRSNRSLSAANYQKLFDTSRATATRDLTDLVRRGLVVQTGKGKGTAYRLAEH